MRVGKVHAHPRFERWQSHAFGLEAALIDAMREHARQRRAPWYERGWATCAELAKLLQRSAETVRRWLDQGRLPELPRSSEARGCDRRIPASAVYELCPDLYQRYALGAS